MLVWQIAKHPTGQIWKNNKEVILKKWDFIDFFCPTFKGHQWHIVEDSDFTISLQFQRVGSKVNLTLAYHRLCNFSFSNQKKKQSDWEKSDRERGNNDSLWFTPFWYPWQLVLVCYKDRIHTEEDMMGKQNPSLGKSLLSRSRKSGSCTWADLFWVWFFFCREIITRDTGI